MCRFVGVRSAEHRYPSEDLLVWPTANYSGPALGKCFVVGAQLYSLLSDCSSGWLYARIPRRSQSNLASCRVYIFIRRGFRLNIKMKLSSGLSKLGLLCSKMIAAHLVGARLLGCCRVTILKWLGCLAYVISAWASRMSQYNSAKSVFCTASFYNSYSYIWLWNFSICSLNLDC